jgi:hypothetical protein
LYEPRASTALYHRNDWLTHIDAQISNAQFAFGHFGWRHFFLAQAFGRTASSDGTEDLDTYTFLLDDTQVRQHVVQHNAVSLHTVAYGHGGMHATKQSGHHRRIFYVSTIGGTTKRDPNGGADLIQPRGLWQYVAIPSYVTLTHTRHYTCTCITIKAIDRVDV